MENKLPKNWVETELGNILKLKNGYAFKSSNYSDKGIPVIRISDIKKGVVKVDDAVKVLEEDKAENFVIEKGDILIAMSGATTGKYGIFSSNIKTYQNQRVGNLKAIDKNLISKKIIFYLIGFCKKQIEDKAYGGAQPNISAKLIETIKIPLPPKAEQERIVAKLDHLFTELDTLNQKLNQIPNLLKNCRQAILNQAVTGKLTKEWRKGKKLEEWEEEKAKDCCEKVQSGGTPKGGNFSQSGIPFFKVYNIVNQKISFEYRPQFISEEIQNTQCKKSICKPNDILMNIVGPPLNKVAIISDKFPQSNINQAITLFRPKNYILPKYLYYYLREGTPVNSLINETRGVVGQVNISLTQCRNFIINIPPKEEQTEIVHRVEQLFTELDRIEAKYKTLKQQTDNLPQAILHKAFKGELVPQLATDGNAEDLLVQLKEEKQKTKDKKK